MEPRTVNDPVIGYLEFDNLISSVIDTPHFQRLRDLKQLGSTFYVFPGATHTRFEHSLGVSHLAGQVITRLRKDQPELEITDSEVNCIRLAGLCHDLGHGPYSHVFDNEFMPITRPGTSWTHEVMSEKMLDDLVTECGIDISTSEVSFIKSLIDGAPKNNYYKTERKFLYQIVANKTNSIDVDKFDYIPRDCYMTGVRTSYDPTRLMTFCRVINGELCYHQKEAYNLYEMFHARYTLHKRVYSHKTSKAIEYMLVDAMVAADNYLGISEATNDPKEYLHLTDSIVKVIERSKAPELEESQAIIKRLRHRDIYRFVDQIIFPPDARKHISKEMLTPERIVRHADTTGSFNEDDVIVHWLVLSYAMKDKNPVDNTRFYSKYNENESFLIPQEHVSMLIPTNYDEAIVRVFTRDGNKRKDIQNAFRNLLASLERSFPGSVFSGSTVEEHTPEKHTIVADYYHETPSPKDSPKRKMQLTPNRALTLPHIQSPSKKRLF